MDCRVRKLDVDRFMILLHLRTCLLFRSVTNMKIWSGHPSTRSLWYQLCSPVLLMVAVVRWLNWLILAVGWFFNSSSSQHLVVYTFGIGFICCISHIHLAAIPRLHHILLKLAKVQSLAGGTEPVRLGRTCQG